MPKPLDTHDERQSAYRGEGPDSDPTGHGRNDPSAPLPEAGAGEGFYPRGHGKGGRLGEGEPDGVPERDGGTQPDFGQAGDAAVHTPQRDRNPDRGEEE
jgi:hypothetical protein